jgi:hypothetical protein
MWPLRVTRMPQGLLSNFPISSVLSGPEVLAKMMKRFAYGMQTPDNLNREIPFSPFRHMKLSMGKGTMFHHA